MAPLGYDARTMSGAFLCAILLLAACERGESLDLRRWSLGATPVDLPAHLPNAAHILVALRADAITSEHERVG